MTHTTISDLLLPFVTIIMPIRNEALYIEQSLTAVLQQDYPHDRMEVLIADGMSTDTTRTRIAQVSRAHPDVALTVLDNPGQIVPTGFNTALQYARGSVIIRVDGHCEITSNYVRHCVTLLYTTETDCVGGSITTIGTGTIARAIAYAQSSHFGVGGVAFRTMHETGRYVDTIAFGAYRREVFDRIGGFDEELVRNQDDEFNFRLTQAGGKIWLDPSIRAVYYSRATLRSLWRQYFQYGFYKVRVIQKRGAVPAWRHLVPAVFVLGLVGSLVSDLVTRRPRLAGIVGGPYLAANLVASVHTARHDWPALPIIPLVFLILHLSYGLGFLYGIWYWRDKSMAQQSGYSRSHNVQQG